MRVLLSLGVDLRNLTPLALLPPCAVDARSFPGSQPVSFDLESLQLLEQEE